jgi:hypothetical protein
MRTFFSTWQPLDIDGAIIIHDARSSALEAGELVEVVRGSSNEVFRVTEVRDRSFTGEFIASSN